MYIMLTTVDFTYILKKTIAGDVKNLDMIA